MSDGAVTIEITGDSSELLKELANLKSKLTDTQQQEEKLGKGVGSFGNMATAAAKTAAAAFAGVSTAITGAAAAAINVGMNFEAAMSNVAAISGATGDELAALEATAKEMGATTQFSATEAANALSYMALAGWDAQQSIDALPGVLDLAAASGMDLAAASDMVTDYLSAFGMEASDSTYFADLLAYAQSNANTTAAALGESFKNCAANMNAAGQDVETTTSLLSMLANQGSKGSEAGTKLAAVMRDLTNNMEDGAIKIGDASVSVMDAEGNFRDLTDILLDVEAATDGMGDAEQSAALSATFTADSISGLNMILNAGVDEAAAFEESLRNSTGTASTMADTMNDNLKGKITELGSALEGVGIQTYEAMEGPLKEGVESAIDSIGTLSDEMSDGRLKDSAEKIAQGFGSIVETAGELAETALPAVVNGFADIVDHGNEVVTVAGSVAAGYAAFKTTTKFVQPLAKGWKAATVALEAHEAASRLTLVTLNGGLPITTTLVGVMTGKITLATAAQAAWNAVASVNPYILIGTAVAAAAVGIGVLVATQEKEVSAYKEVVDSVYEEKEALDELKESRDEAISSNLAEIDNAEALIYQYKALADETGVVREGTDEYARAKALAKQINAVAPGAIEDLEDENGAYLQICDSIDLLIAKKRAEAIADANQESYDTAIQNRQQYVEKLNELDEQRKAALQELQDAQDAYAQWDSDYNKHRIEEAQEAVDEIAAAYDEQVQKVVDAEQTIASQEQLWAAMESDSIEQVKAAIDGYGNKVVEFTGNNAAACQESAQHWEDYYNKLKSLQDQGVINDEAWVESVRQTYEEQKRIADDAITAQAESVSEMIQSVRSKTSDAGEASKAISDAMVDGLGDLGSELSDEGKNALVTAIAVMEVEASNANSVGEALNAGLYDGVFASLGLSTEAGRELMKETIDAIKDEADSHSPSRKMIEQGMYLDQGLGNGITENASLATTPASSLMQQVLSVVQGGLTSLPVIGGLFGSLFGGGITGNAGAATGAASSVGVDAVSAAQASVSGMTGVGSSGSSMIGSGFLSNQNAATSAAQSVLSSAASSAQANTKVFSSAGQASMAAYAAAIRAGSATVVSAAQAATQASATAIVAQRGLYTQAANVLMTTLSTGIKAKQSTVTTATTAAAKAGVSGVNSTRSSYQSAGYNLSLGIAAGIRSGQSSVISAATNVAKNAISAAKAALGINSPSKVAEREVGKRYDEGFAKGQIKHAGVVEKSSKDVATQAVDTAAETLNERLTLDTIISRDSGIGERLLAAVTSRVSHVSTTTADNAHTGALLSGGQTIHIDYHPEQKCDEPVSARRLYEINTANARQLGRTLKHV
ncbi:MAG: phage tail tape measure protein [Eubacteriales bacterium]|nr:phage tail tape measure protein [Eubacteriales bacterium]